MSGLSEDREIHLSSSLSHIAFLRDLARATGRLDEISACGWMYGEHEGANLVELYPFQLKDLFSLLDVPMQAAVWTWCEIEDDEEFIESLVFADDGASVSAAEEVWSLWTEEHLWIEVAAPADILREWQAWWAWSHPGERLIMRHQGHHETGDTWIICVHDGAYDTDAVMDFYREILTIWEVKTYYDHVGNTDAWRRLRGRIDADAAPERTAHPHDPAGCQNALPDNDATATADPAGPQPDPGATPARGSSRDESAAAAATHAVASRGRDGQRA